MKRKKIAPYLYLIFAIFLSIIVLIRYHSTFESETHFTPSYQKLDILPILQKDSFTANDYHCLFYQTGLSPDAIDEIMATNQQPYNTILQVQTNFFEPQEIICSFNSPLSKEEHITPTNNPIVFAPYSESYILLTFASHTFFYRNGHAALIIDGKNNKTLEAAVLGSNSSIQSVKKWATYPNFILLRLKTLTKPLALRITATATQQLHNIPYRLTAGLFSSRTSNQQELNGTQCAHLVWYAYHQNGYDLDSDGGKVVTPNDLLESDLLEIVQIYGMDPTLYANRVLE